jgi:hypothetical protein
MNKQFAELWEKTRTRPLEGGSWTFAFPDERAEKFAELIVQQCVDICVQGNATQTTSNGAAEMIKMHFGIK